jgi:hypothetical protein
VTAPDSPKRWLPRLGVAAALGLISLCFVVTMIRIARASNVPGGLRGATHTEWKIEDVDSALESASVSALLIPPSVLLLVLSGLSIARERRSAVRPESRA